MRNIKEKIVNRLPNIMTTKSGFLKLDQDQKEALAERLEIFLMLEFKNAHDEGLSEGISKLPIISLN